LVSDPKGNYVAFGFPVSNVEQPDFFLVCVSSFSDSDYRHRDLDIQYKTSKGVFQQESRRQLFVGYGCTRTATLKASNVWIIQAQSTDLSQI